MLFIKVEDLKPGMRLGKPIYNKNGVLLHERDSKLTRQTINGIENFGLMGLYILEPAEPVPPMTEEDINFERFQTMSVFGIKEDLNLIAEGKNDKGLDWLCSLVIKNYSQLDHKINFVQSLRSNEDFVYKHVLNVAILTAIIGGQLSLPMGRINMLVKAAILHDIGMLAMPDIMNDDDNDVLRREAIRQNTMDLLSRYRNLEMDIENLIGHVQNMYCTEEKEQPEAFRVNVNANIIYVADAYDRMTAMKSYEEPTSEVSAIRELLKRQDLYDRNVVNALIRGINILYPGVCVELTNGEDGLVIRENEEEIFQPMVLGFNSNTLYDLSTTKDLEIKDVMKTMDNRIKIDPDLLAEYM